MKKTIKVTGIIVSLGLFFAAGSLTGKNTGASTDWVTNAINSAYSEMITTANSTVDDVTANVETDANETVNTAIQSTVDEQQAELDRLLKEYYQMKLDGLTESEQFLQLEAHIEVIQQDLLNTFKQRIDEEFNRVSGVQTTP